jgi:hypothetical protein
LRLNLSIVVLVKVLATAKETGMKKKIAWV